MSFTSYLTQRLLNHLFSKSAYTAPSLYVGLLSAGLTELSGNAYARVLVPAASWTSMSATVMANNTDVTFPTATAEWGTVTTFGLFDAVSGGNLLASADLDLPVRVRVGDTASFAAGMLTISLF